MYSDSRTFNRPNCLALLAVLRDARTQQWNTKYIFDRFKQPRDWQKINSLAECLFLSGLFCCRHHPVPCKLRLFPLLTKRWLAPSSSVTHYSPDSQSRQHSVAVLPRHDPWLDIKPSVDKEAKTRIRRELRHFNPPTSELSTFGYQLLSASEQNIMKVLVLGLPRTGTQCKRVAPAQAQCPDSLPTHHSPLRRPHPARH